MPLRVGLDARSLSTHFVRGMGEYILSLIETISESHDACWSLYGNRPDLPFHAPRRGQVRRTVLRDIPGHRLALWEQTVLPLQAALNRIDVLHCTATTLPIWQPVPTVVTVHYTIPWDTDEAMHPGIYRDRLLPAAYAKCEAIIAISHHSRNDIVRLWPGLANKIRVIHHGVHREFLDCRPSPPTDTLRGLGVGRPYLLYLGGTTPRKRLSWTLRLFQAIDRPGVDLVVCGVPEQEHAAYRNALEPALRRQVVFLPFVPAADMPSLYQNAIAVLYPTLYEGFGFPAVNAQAVGTPVILTAVSSLLELVGPTSIALPPEAEAAWVEACRTQIDKRADGGVPDEATRVWARRFDWRVAAGATWEVYQQAAARRKRAQGA